MNSSGPLTDLRVIDLTDDLGRFGTKLLAEFGAEVCRPSGWGSSGRAMPGSAGGFGGHLDWWFDAAKTSIELDFETEAGRQRYRELAAGADLIIESMPLGRLQELGLDYESLRESNPRLTQVSLTPFGRTGPRAGWQTSDLVAGALGGVLSITGEPDYPLNSWGSQNYNFGGFAAAICGLAGVRSAREHGRGQLVDLSLHEVVTGSIENLFMQYFYDDRLELPKLAARQGSLHWLGAYEVVPAKTGHVMITPTPQSEQLINWMIECGITEAEPFIGLAVEELLARMPELMAAMKAFTLTKHADELFDEGQKRHIAFGEVQRTAQVAANPQFEFRDLYSDIPAPAGGAVKGDTSVSPSASSSGPSSGASVRGPWRLVRFGNDPIATPQAPSLEPADTAAIAARWLDQQGDRHASDRSTGAESVPRPLDGLVVLDLSWVLAGPFSTRLLGDLGADVIKVQTEERATLVNRPDFPYYPVWNRSKRSATLNLKRPEALPVIRQLVENADILVENYSSGVLDRLGLGWEDVRQWNDQLIYISMSGCGHEGPWKDVISYAPTIHALCGLTELTNPAGRGDVGCGFSLNDHAAGFGAALSVLAAMEARERTGLGQHIDMAQLEVGTYLTGPALIDYWANGHETTSAGNVDGLADVVPNEVYRCADDRWLAITAIDDAMWAKLAMLLGHDGGDALAEVAGRRLARAQIDQLLSDWCKDQNGEAAMVRLQEAGVAAGIVQNAADLADHDEQLVARGFWLTAELGEFGERRHDRFPGLWSEADLAPYRNPPSYLGEANFEVWTELGGVEFDEVAEGIADGLFS
ncbi:MAG: CoA transferase [Acidimicrobiales bacterium]